VSWGPLPKDTFELVAGLGARARFVRGNADRHLCELAAGAAPENDHERFVLEHHDEAARTLLAGFPAQLVLAVEGLGGVRVTHGSPRSDEECVTPRTPDARMRELLAGVEQPVLTTAHTHLQFDRRVAGVRSVNPGSVGLPYMGEPGAFWALLGPDIDLRRTAYDVDETERRYRASGSPLAERLVGMLRTPPTPDEVIEDAERRVFAG
jgi:predicted phosphodiesterase